uniref:Uncharacterized protein n=1 Tax=Sphaerodactylus townsendi TaxID=933632 RepID=A0ACB8GD13_9SAUR
MYSKVLVLPVFCKKKKAHSAHVILPITLISISIQTYQFSSPLHFQLAFNHIFSYRSVFFLSCSSAEESVKMLVADTRLLISSFHIVELHGLKRHYTLQKGGFLFCICS